MSRKKRMRILVVGAAVTCLAVSMVTVGCTTGQASGPAQ